jgi:arylsulfatase
MNRFTGLPQSTAILIEDNRMLTGKLCPAIWAFVTMLAVSHGSAQTVLPRPEPPFSGTIDRDVRRSTPAWPTEVVPPKGAPNVLLILVDDVGFSTTSTFGGPIPTPNFDQLAAHGLRYNEFHVNAICAPSRASLLSGRNNHEIGFGTITEHAQGYPGYNSIWPASSASIAKVLVENGYNTAAFGKWHNTPVWEINPAGPFDRWPTGKGFEYFYGFLSAFDNQYFPRLYRDTTPVEPSKTPEEGYSLTTDMTDDAIHWLHRHDAAAPNKPFFLYFATAATHTPHQVPKQWIEPFKGKFDGGWDKLRAENFEREKKLGVIPANAEDTPRPEGLAAWDSLPPAEKKLLAHQAEVYAGFTAQADHEIGRLIQAIKEEGQLDNTLIIEIVGDNGGSAEDGPTGYDMRQINGKLKSVPERAEDDADLGSELYMNATAAPWAWAFSTPFQGTKADASHLGGTRDPMVISWPERIKKGGGLRSQFSHLVDIAPTIYEAAGILPPSSVDGVAQTKLEGESLLYTFDHPQAPSRHTIQYFETNGNRAIYKDGWWAGDLLRSSWDRIGSPGYERDKLLDGHTHPWELYNLTEDYSQAHNLADKYPDKLKEMEALFDSEAKRNQVYPLLPLRELINRPENDRKTFVLREGVNRLQDTMNPHTGAGTGYTIRAEIDNPSGAASGVILAQGSRYGGFTLFVKNRHVYFEVNSFGHKSGQIVSKAELATGHSTIRVDVIPDLPSAEVGGKAHDEAPFPGKCRLSVNGGESPLTNFINLPAGGGYWSPAETLDVGSDLGSAVSREYTSPNSFTGKINSVTLEIHERPGMPTPGEKAARNDGHS